MRSGFPKTQHDLAAALPVHACELPGGDVAQADGAWRDYQCLSRANRAQRSMRWLRRHRVSHPWQDRAYSLCTSSGAQWCRIGRLSNLEGDVPPRVAAGQGHLDAP